ncbi:hypothetical protein MKEN_00159400 [Mycena kentingensis (nom. inval.)]|nr:hypothetical protein MKEN_00159400 [Mycena kentingensis (nom. inval.)]
MKFNPLPRSRLQRLGLVGLTPNYNLPHTYCDYDQPFEREGPSFRKVVCGAIKDAYKTAFRLHERPLRPFKETPWARPPPLYPEQAIPFPCPWDELSMEQQLQVHDAFIDDELVVENMWDYRFLVEEAWYPDYVETDPEIEAARLRIPEPRHRGRSRMRTNFHF